MARLIISLRSFEIWLYGLFNAAIGGAASALGGIVGPPIGHAVGVEIKPLDWDQVKMVAVGGAVVSLVFYLKQSPLPKRVDVAEDAKEDK